MEMEQVEQLIKDLFATDPFPEGIAILKLTEDPEKAVADCETTTAKVKTLSTLLSHSDTHSQYGMKFLLTQGKQVNISSDTISAVMGALAKIYF